MWEQRLREEDWLCGDFDIDGQWLFIFPQQKTIRPNPTISFLLSQSTTTHPIDLIRLLITFPIVLYRPTSSPIPILSNMGPRKIYIDDSLKEVICTPHDQKRDRKGILDHLTKRYGFTISIDVLKKHLRTWGKRRYDMLPSKNDIYLQNLKAAILDLFVNLNATDDMILVDLESQGLSTARRKIR